MNFATLQGLTIPEGVVTQITDASGRVLWSADTPVVYLRPSADISLEHPVYPETLTAGYLAICEAVSDGAATYIGATGITLDTHIECDSTFRMSLSKPANIKRVVSAKIVADIVVDFSGVSQSDNYSRCDCYVSVLGQEVFNGVKKIEYLSMANNPHSRVDTITNGDTTNLVNAINEYISSNGVGSFPEITVRFYNRTKGNNSKSSFSSYVSQFCIELTYE